MRRLVDLSIFLENDVISDPPPMRPKIDYIRHDTGAEQMADFFEGLDK
ncbi:MAG: cyclase family protein, partial [Pseudomonadota bacterium]|nr:cyclase family protein [Pseudomonadota bacterium]